jgi:hypothetical protein
MARYFGSIVIAFLLLFPVLARSQSDLARLEGRVRDASGTAIANAKLVLADDRTGWQDQVTTDADGHYLFPAVRSAECTLTVEADKFKRVIRRNVVLKSPGTNVEDFQLQPRTARETVVREVALGSVIRRSDTVEASGYSWQEIQALSIVSRDPLLLPPLQPGVNGTRQTSNFTTLDGVSISDPNSSQLGTSLTAVTPDSIDGMRVITAGGASEYGQPGAQIKILTRKGTRALSGSLYEYYRTKALNAGDFFSNAQYNPTNPSFGQNNFGGTFGAPLRKDKTFLFANYEGLRGNREVPVNALVLTPSAKAGVFQWYLPGTNTLQSYNIVSGDPRKLGIDPTIQSMLAGVPEPNNTNIGDYLNNRGYWYNSPTDQSHDLVTARVDHTASDAQRLFARFSWDRLAMTDIENGAVAPYPGTVSGTQKGKNYAAVAGSDWNLSPRTANEFRFGYSRWKLDIKRPARSAQGNLIPSAWSSAMDYSYPRTSGFPIFEASDSISFLRGNHMFKAGGLFRRTVQDSTEWYGTSPDIRFGTGYGNIPTVGPSSPSIITSYDRQQFEYLYNNLLGRVEQMTQTFYSDFRSYLSSGSPADRSFRYYDAGAFLQDDWKARPNFLVSLGLRYEWATVPSEQNGLRGALDKAAQMTTGANLVGISVVPDGAWYKRDRNNFAPRLGFAWDISKKGHMVLRGSYGMFFDHAPGSANRFVDQNTTALSQFIGLYPNSSGTDRRYRDNLPLPSAPSSVVKQPATTRSISTAIFDPELKTGVIQQFRLGVERLIIPNTYIEASYVGSRSTNLLNAKDLNQTRIQGDFLTSFKQLQAFRAYGTAVPATNTLVKIFGSPSAAVAAIGGSNIDQGLVGVAADTVDRTYYYKYAPAGVSDFYLRPYPQFNQVFLDANDGRSWYDSLQVKVRRHHQIIDVVAQYTWSKFQDTVRGSDYKGPWDNSNYHLNKSPSDFDRTHVFSGYVTWRSPIGRDRAMWTNLPPLLEAMIGGWDIGAKGTYATGQRFSVFSGQQKAEAGVNTLANYTGSRKIGQINRQADSVWYFDGDQIAQFTIPATGERGNSGRNSFIGPEYMSIDASLYKSFHIGQRKSVVFKAEFMNLFNRTNFGMPINDMSDPNGFGRITTTVGSPRAMQMSLRYNF